MKPQGESVSPRQVFEQAVADGPLSHAERIAKRCAIAAVRAQDEAKRAAPSPQSELDLAA